LWEKLARSADPRPSKSVIAGLTRNPVVLAADLDPGSSPG
jgi:hypothetical protein